MSTRDPWTLLRKRVLAIMDNRIRTVTMFSLLVSTVLLNAQTNTQFTWKPVNIQGMGYVTGIIATPTNKLYVKTDVGGVYRWDAARQEWLWLNRTINWLGSGGVDIESMAVDPHPSRANRFYAVYEQPKPYQTPWAATQYNHFGEVLYTDNDGLTWTPTGLLAQEVPVAGNGIHRTNTGERLMADPNRADYLYFASHTRGLFRRDLAVAGGAWTQLGGGLPDPNTLDDGSTGGAESRAGFTFVAFDARGATAGAPTQRVYTGAYGKGIYVSTNGGSSWTLIADPQNRNRYPLRGVTASNGVLWATFDRTSGDPAVRRFDPVTSTWSDVTWSNPAWPGTTLVTASSITVDPTDPNRIAASGSFAGRDRSAIVITRNNSGQYSAVVHHVLRTPDPDIPGAVYAANQPDYYFNDASALAAGLTFDPLQPARLYQSSGFGFVYTETANSPTAAWTWRMKGLEELVATGVKVPHSGPVQLYSSHMDMIGFRHMNRDVVPVMADRMLPFGHAVNPDYVVGTGWYGWVPFAFYNGPRWPDGHVVSALGLDISAKQPNFVAFTGMHQWTSPWGISGYTSDGGVSWRPFPSIPTSRMWTTRWIMKAPDQWVGEDVERDLKAIGGVVATGADFVPGHSMPNIVWVPKSMGANDRMLSTNPEPFRYLAGTTAFGRMHYFDHATQTWKRSFMRNPDTRPADVGDPGNRNLHRFFDSPPLSWAHHALGGPAATPYNYANVVAADRVDPNIFYYLSDGGSEKRSGNWARLFVSTDGGKIWDEIFWDFEGLSPGVNAGIAFSPRPLLVPHPTRRGEVWICFGVNREIAIRASAYRARLSGTTWSVTRLSTLKAVDALAFGRSPQASGPPAMYVKGQVPSATRDAILQSVDDGATWREINDPTQNSFAGAIGLEGDMRTANLVYVYSAGRGVSYGVGGTAPPPPPPPTLLRYDFETSTQAWEVAGASPGLAMTLAQSSPGGPAFSGSRSLQVNVTASGAGQKSGLVRVEPIPTPPGGGRQITYRIRIPAGAPVSGVAFVQANDWAWTAMDPGAPDANGWRTARVTVPAAAALPVNRIGFAIQVNGAWTGTVHIDAVTW
jgi:xyloglucan-specific exo-beta-1,4-glucanase